MKKDLNVYNLAVFSQLEPQTDNHRPADPESEVDVTILKNMLDEIFTIDEVSGFPKGDIQYYLSPNGNPLVRQWLENNLLKPRMSSGSSMAEISDDLRVEFSRGSDETLVDWQNHLKHLKSLIMA